MGWFYLERENDAIFVRETMARMARVSRKIRIALNVLLVVYLIMIAVAIVVMVLAGFGTASNDFEKVFSAVSRLLAAGVVAVLIVILSKAFQDVSESQSPFTIKQAKRIMLMGLILILNVAVEAISSAFAPIASEYAGVNVAFVSAPLTTNLHIDVMSLVAAIVCFCLSYLFRYGALLQWLQDETL